MQALAEDRRQQAAELAHRRDALNKLYTNNVGEEFQGRFGASLR